jgi:endonuclease/exonuclease/phosphatase (EEP) superfamily protein YafD
MALVREKLATRGRSTGLSTARTWRWLTSGLGDTRRPAVIAWLTLTYTTVATAVAAAGWWFGDATWWLYVANLASIYWLAPALLALPVALFRRWWLPAAASLVPATIWLATFGPLFVPQKPQTPSTLRVASYNISPHTDLDHVGRMVERTNPDVLLVQELLPGSRGDLVEQVSSLRFRLFSAVNPRSAGGGGTAVLSRYPIVDVQPVTGLPATSRPTDIVTIDGGDTLLNVVSLHLTSSCGVECLHDGVPLTKMAQDSALREAETQQVLAALPRGPAIVGGDLNSSTANMPRRLLMAGGLTDLHRAVGSGPGFTRVGAFRGALRVDWLFASAQVIPVREWTARRDGSDHRPVVADVRIATRKDQARRDTSGG